MNVRFRHAVLILTIQFYRVASYSFIITLQLGNDCEQLRICAIPLHSIIYHGRLGDFLPLGEQITPANSTT